MNYNLDKAHEELCTFFGKKSMKDKPELLLKYFETQMSIRNAQKIAEAIKSTIRNAPKTPQ